MSIARILSRALAVTFATGVLSISTISAQDSRADSLFDSIRWTSGPGKTQIGSFVEFSIPAYCRFTDKSGVAAFMEITQNTGSDEDAVLLCPGASGKDGTWFVLFRYDPSGYVKDDESKSLDAPRILETLRRGTAAANKERVSRGWDTLNIVGWVRPPYYDAATHNLTWSAEVASPNGVSVNHSVRLLGRGGVLHAELVTEPSQVANAVARFDEAIAGTSFIPGERYSEWRSGDKVAAYGLTALVAGGAGAAAVKLGLFAKLWKLIAGFFLALWKFLALAVVGVVGWIRSLLRSKTRDSESSSPARPDGP